MAAHAIMYEKLHSEFRTMYEIQNSTFHCRAGSSANNRALLNFEYLSMYLAG